MAIFKTRQELENLKEGGKILARILNMLKEEIGAGLSTLLLEEKAKSLISQFGVRASFLGYRNYPASLCVSINDEIVHGVPSERVIQKGDIVKIDLGIWYKDVNTDSALTVLVGRPASPKISDLIETTYRALGVGISKARLGNFTGDIGAAIQKEIEKPGFVVIKELSGHGLGHAVHEEPMILNFGKPKDGVKLEEGMVLAIEPMAALFGSGEIIQADDGFAYKTKDGAPSAHFEHTIIITDDKPLIITKE